MSVRKEVADQIKADNPTFIVHDYPVNDPEGIPAGKTWVSVIRDRFEVADNNSYITHHLTVVIATDTAMTAQAEDALDAAVDALMLTLERFDDVYWKVADRKYVKTFPAYEISLEAIRPQVYKTQILTA